MQTYLWAASVLIGMTGCATNPSVSTDPIAPQTTALATVASHSWWDVFHDPLMDRMAMQLLAQNLDIQMAESRMAEARGILKATISGWFPSVNAVGSSSRGNDAVGASKAVSMQKGGFDTQWELDLFGKTRSQFRGVRARWQAKVALLEDMKHTMLFELMRAIVAWRQAQETLEETKDLLTTQDKQIALFTQRSQAGLIDATFLLRAQAERAHTSTHLPLAQAEADRARYSIARLLAMPADQLELEDARHGSFHLPSVDRVVSVDAEILRERPDVRALRAQMLAAQSDLKAAEADLWPRLSVGAFFGVQHGSDGVKLASNPIWSLASSLTFPILDFGRLRGAVDVANARARAASLEYENGVLLALQEVQTALSDYLNGINAVACQEKTHRFRKDTVKLASDRFAQGLTDMTDLTTAQSELNQATIQLIDQRALAATAYIRLQKALGVSHRLSAPKETP